MTARGGYFRGRRQVCPRRPSGADTLAWMERLSASDMSSLLAERGPIHVHVGGTLILEGDPPPFDVLLEHVSARLPLVPRFRQRITEARIQFSNPSWTDGPQCVLRG